MSSTVLHHWLHQFRSSLKDRTVPTTVSLPNGQQAESPASYVEITRDVLAGREAPVSFARLAAHGVSCEAAIVLVTPEIAERYLKNQNRNRWQKKKHLQFLVGQMRDGEWKFNGEPLIFDQNNQMIDGQHRCLSCVKSGRPFLTLVVRNIQRDAYDRIDLGARRTSRDVLVIEDVPMAKWAAPTVARLLEFRRSGNWWEPRSDITGHEIFRALPDFPDLERHYAPGKEMARLFGGSQALWAAARYLTFEKDQAAAHDFWAKLLTGERLEPGDPELRLRQRLLDARLSAGKIELTLKLYAGLIVAAWNHRRKGRQVKMLLGLRGDEPVPAFL